MTIFSETTKDVGLNLWGSSVTIPKGTRVHLVKGASGNRGDLWAVVSTKLLTELTKNAHDPIYRYAWVPSDAVASVKAGMYP